MSAGKVIVVGGGIIGTACTTTCRAVAGKSRSSIRGNSARGCSHANCGFVCPSHVLPLAAPGALAMALRSLFRRDSPFHIKPRIDLGLWHWLYRFAPRCNRHDMLDAGHAIQALLELVAAALRRIAGTEPIECEWQTRGLLFVFRSQHGMDHYTHTDRMLQAEFNLARGPLRSGRPDAAGAGPQARVGRRLALSGRRPPAPDRLMTSWRRMLETRGVAIRESCEVQGFLAETGRTRARDHVAGGAAGRGVRGGGRGVDAAAGQSNWAAGFRSSRARATRSPCRGRPAARSYPMIFEEHRVAVTPMRPAIVSVRPWNSRVTTARSTLGGSICCGRGEPLSARTDLRTCRGRMVRLAAHDLRQQADHRPLPRRGPMSSSLRTQHVGLSMAPATGKLVAELLTDSPPHVDPGPYAVTRF